MTFDPLRFRVLVHALAANGEGARELSADNARTIVAIATLAADVDLDEVRAETDLLASLAEELCARAQISPATLLSISPLSLDKTERASRIHQLAGRLTDVRGRELAYVAAYLVAVADLELAPVESGFLDELRRTLELDDDRATGAGGRDPRCDVESVDLRKGDRRQHRLRTRAEGL